jgi:hypothetical protein
VEVSETCVLGGVKRLIFDLSIRNLFCADDLNLEHGKMFWNGL